MATVPRLERRIPRPGKRRARSRAREDEQAGEEREPMNPRAQGPGGAVVVGGGGAVVVGGGGGAVVVGGGGAVVVGGDGAVTVSGVCLVVGPVVVASEVVGQSSPIEIVVVVVSVRVATVHSFVVGTGIACSPFTQ